MQKKQKEKPNYAFIDGQNLYLGTKESGFDLEYGKFRIYLREKYKIERAYIFIGYIEKNKDLYDSLQDQGYILKFKPVLPAKKGLKQKGDVDADMAFNIMKYYKEYYGAVLITSDGDFDTIVAYLRKKKKLTAVISPSKEKCSSLLQKAAQEKIFYIENIGQKIEKAPPRDETQSSAFS